ncbi:hypothetical protein I7I51_02733 [Histoplasma capsulatum]|uniref:Uncharacterized protein n=1 Tax=Ajellomyces capsulatus TaxID=5037 RepID=A0A8A1ML20_AJECA|nr:hypothetical protein I7I51_02733 [Histoplasma capsulatum]
MGQEDKELMIGSARFYGQNGRPICHHFGCPIRSKRTDCSHFRPTTVRFVFIGLMMRDPSFSCLCETLGRYNPKSPGSTSKARSLVYQKDSVLGHIKFPPQAAEQTQDFFSICPPVLKPARARIKGSPQFTSS